MNPLKALQEYGQSVWLDYIRRDLITSGELQRLIEEDGLRGMTSNPAIFEKAITGGNYYAESLGALKGQQLNAMALYEHLAIRDIQDAADIFRTVYAQTRKRDGYVSLEVSPHLAHDTQKTIDEARRLWKAVDRPNVMIKVPASPEGLPAIEQLISEGINVNVTLLFAQEVYERVAQAYINGLERRAAQGGDLSHVASVASFFISRIDTAIDALVRDRLKTAPTARERMLLRSIIGKVAIANGKLTYQRYKEIFHGPGWEALASKGAHTQRVLWASTSTKDPKYRDVMYVEELIGPDTVNTMPPATLEAFREHGRVRPSLEENLDQARDTMEILEQVGISMREVTDKLLVEGVRLFAEPFDKLLDAAAQQTGQTREEVARHPGGDMMKG
jgi:transaldolase/glucose-6-phosphate isomerase